MQNVTQKRKKINGWFTPAEIRFGRMILLDNTVKWFTGFKCFNHDNFLLFLFLFSHKPKTWNDFICNHAKQQLLSKSIHSVFNTRYTIRKYHNEILNFFFFFIAFSILLVHGKTQKTNDTRKCKFIVKSTVKRGSRKHYRYHVIVKDATS